MILHHDTDLRAHACERRLPQVNTIDADRAARRVVEADQQLDERRLAGAGGADHRDPLPRLDPERHAVQHRFVLMVGEADVVELDTAARSPEDVRVGRIRNRRWGVEQLEDSLE